jgi:acylphosphatase
MKKGIECTVYGIVQRVLYRDFVKRSARKIGITGTVENRKDSTVFICAEGEEENLSLFLKAVHKGSFFSKVEKVDVVWKSAEGNYSDFSIVY